MGHEKLALSVRKVKNEFRWLLIEKCMRNPILQTVSQLDQNLPSYNTLKLKDIQNPFSKKYFKVEEYSNHFLRISLILSRYEFLLCYCAKLVIL